MDISPPSSTDRTFQLPKLSALLESEAERSSWMQLSLAYDTYLQSESSLIDLPIYKENKELKTIMRISYR